ncbi:thioredoxin family protein [Algoriphagus sp. Y33]|uniref:TlpA family protein disulfide reductase n=1 Tax=Algoriphagus sp. Y33 TaxID=2772483 RepID=UPI0017828935|nr:thioredoxin family protein [Algoriphagus sp. Y33]
MKKLILICLLGYLCVPTSTLPAQVADSPGADFLHRSGLPAVKQVPDELPLDTVVGPIVSPEQGDTHRGGVTRSDTLPENSGLVDHSGQGQEGVSSSAEVGEAAPVVIYGEVRSPLDQDQVTVTLWGHYLDQQEDKGLGEDSDIELSPGVFYHGSLGKKTFDFISSPISETAYLSLSIGSAVILDRFLIQPGDSLRLLVDQIGAKVEFAGPAGPKFRIQQDLVLAQNEFKSSLPPILFTKSKESYLQRGTNASSYERAHTRSNSILPLLEILERSDRSIAYLGKVMELEAKAHPGWGILTANRDVFQPDFYRILEAELLGKIGLLKVGAFNAVYSSSPRMDSLYRAGIMSLTIPEELNANHFASPSFLDFIFEYCTARSVVEKISVFDLYRTFPSQFTDRLMAKYIVKYHKLIPDPEPKFREVLQSVKDPWVYNLVAELYSSFNVGAPFPDVELLTAEGTTLNTADLKGKFLLFDYWISGCGACAGLYQNFLAEVEDYFQGNGKVRIVTINTDRNRKSWTDALQTGKYTSAENINLWTGGKKHELLSHYNILAFPTMMLVDPDGNLNQAGNFPKTAAGMIELLEGKLQGHLTSEQ